MIQMDIFLHDLTNKYESKTLIVQKTKVKAFSPKRTAQIRKYIIFERAAFEMKS